MKQTALTLIILFAAGDALAQAEFIQPAPVVVQPQVVEVQPPPVVVQPPLMMVQQAPIVVAATAPDVPFTQSPAYKQCAQLATTNPIAAEAKAAEWLKIDDGVGPHHCRAMALYGQRRFAEAGQELSAVRGKIAPGNIVLRSYVAQQASKAWMDAGRPDAAITALTEQVTDMGTVRGDNAGVSLQTSALLLQRAKLRMTYGQAPAAVQDLDHAVSLTPTDEAVLMQRAAAFAAMNDIALAKLDVASVLKLDPANSKALELQRLLNNPNGK